MANRVLLGKRGSDYGLFVSKPGEDVEDATDATNLSFDSRAVGSLFVAGATPLKGEGSLAAPTSGYIQGTISHSLGYIPAYAVRWCYASDLSNGVAQRMYNPSNILMTNISWINWVQYNDTANGGIDCVMTDESLFLYNFESGIEHSVLTPAYTDVAAQVIYYAYIIFQTPDFTGGFSL